MPTVEEIKKELKKRGIEFPPKARKAELEKLLLLEESSPDKPVAEEQETSVVFLNGAKRILAVVDYKDNEIDLDICEGHNGNCTNFAFEYSSGTSNVYNFRNIFLPILRQEADGWLNKDGGVGTILLLKQLTFHFRDILKPRRLTEKCMNEMGTFIREFVDRFGCWKQLQISALLAKPEDLWFNTLFFRTLREFVLTHNYCSFPPNGISILRGELQTIEDRLAKAGKPNIREMLREKIPFVNADQAKKLILKIDEIERNNLSRAIEEAKKRAVLSTPDNFFYRRLEPIKSDLIEYVLPAHNRDESVNYEAVNKWLLDNNALCLRADTRARKTEFEADLKKAEEKSKEPVQVASDPDRYFGWLKCDE